VSLASSLATTRAPDRDRHIAFLDSLRGLAALYVVLHHAFRTVNWSNAPQQRQIFAILDYGHYSVCLFLMISGFCLTLPTLRNGHFLRRGFGNYIARRALRIIPPYYLAMVPSLLLACTLIHEKTGSAWDDALPVTPRDIFTHVLLVHDLFDDSRYKINYPFWSISIEWRIYFLLPLLLWSWRRVGLLKTTVITVLGSCLLQVASREWLGIYPTMHFLGLFALGMLAAAISYGDNPSFNALRQLRWGWLSLASGAVFLSSLSWGRYPVIFDTVFGVFGTCLLIFISLRPSGIVRRALQSPPLVGMGSFAYSTYLIHAPVLQVLSQYCLVPLQASPTMALLTLLFVGTPIVLLVAYIFYRLVERPFAEWKLRPSAALAQV
jgi:peptidoglycan/LPS O-acetylase OafA/YrhL